MNSCNQRNCVRNDWRTASRALRTLFCVSSMRQPSVRRSEFAGKPSHGSRFHGVARNDFVLYGIALGAFVQAMLKADGSQADARKHHARRAARTARALNGRELRTG
jgi:hypothetical protein